MDQVVVDSSVLITFLIAPTGELETRKHHQVIDLFRRIESVELTGLLPEVVLHETFYTLLGRRFPDTQLSVLCDVIARILHWHGWLLTDLERSIYLRALDILQQQPKLEFSDAVIAARAETHEATLATFDKRLAAAFAGPIWDEA